MAEIQGELDSPRTISSLRGGPHHRAKLQVDASDKDARLWYRTTSWTVRREWDCCGGQVSRVTGHSQSRLDLMNAYWGTSILQHRLQLIRPYCYRRCPFRTIQSFHEHLPMSTTHTASAGMGVLMALMASVPLTLYRECDAALCPSSNVPTRAAVSDVLSPSSPEAGLMCRRSSLSSVRTSWSKVSNYGTCLSGARSRVR